jgi:hypothetical protein
MHILPLVFGATVSLVQPIDAYTDATDKANNEHAECLIRQTKRFVVLCEPAETIAQAALSSCNKEEMRLRSAFLAGVLSVQEVDQVMADLRENRKGLIVAYVLDQRLKSPCPQR